MIVITYADYERDELEDFEPRVVHVDRSNRVIDEDTGPPRRRARQPVPGVTPAAAPGTAPGVLDVLVLGSGVAGLSAAVRLATPGRARRTGGLRVGVLTKAELWQSATRWAQGGVAAVLGGDEDSTDLHLADTLAAGAGLCDADAVRVLVDEGPARVRRADRPGGASSTASPGGDLALAREGGHSTRPGRPRRRGGHRGRGRAGPGRRHPGRRPPPCSRSWFALDLLVEGGRCRGVVALDADGRAGGGAGRATRCWPPAGPASSSR